LVYDGQAISNVLAVSVTGLESGQVYWLAYRVYNRAGWSTLSPILHLVSGKLPQPPIKTPHQISVSSTQITFGWEASLDIGGASKLESYNVYVENTVVATVNAGILQYTYTDGIVAGQSYRCSISAVSLIGEGPKSNPLTIWAVSVPSAPTLQLTETSRDSCSV